MVARCLHEQEEVFMGRKMLGPGPGNDKGHYEDMRFLMLNDRILREAGGSWDNPPSKEAIEDVSEKFSTLIKQLISESEAHMSEAGYKSWGFKDPRTCITLPAYMPHIDNPRFLIVKRPSIEVAESLNKRDGRPIEDGINLARVYNERIDSYDILR